MLYITLIIWLLLDFITKYLATIYLKEKVSLVGDFVYLQLTYNPWIAFGIKVPFWLLKIWTLALIIWIYYYYRGELQQEKNPKKQNTLSFAFGLILAWAIWNGFERVLNERVIDFVWVQYFSIFNLADSFISIWALLLIYYYYNKK